jgi:hypothetical protein
MRGVRAQPGPALAPIGLYGGIRVCMTLLWAEVDSNLNGCSADEFAQDCLLQRGVLCEPDRIDDDQLGTRSARFGNPGFARMCGAGRRPGRQRIAERFDIAPTGGRLPRRLWPAAPLRGSGPHRQPQQLLAASINWSPSKVLAPTQNAILARAYEFIE